MPADYPDRGRYVTLFKEMAEQGARGAGPGWLLAIEPARSRQPAESRDERHRVFRLHAGVGHQQRPARSGGLRAERPQGLGSDGARGARRRHARLGAADRRRARARPPSSRPRCTASAPCCWPAWKSRSSRSEQSQDRVEGGRAGLAGRRAGSGRRPRRPQLQSRLAVHQGRSGRRVGRRVRRPGVGDGVGAAHVQRRRHLRQLVDARASRRADPVERPHVVPEDVPPAGVVSRQEGVHRVRRRAPGRRGVPQRDEARRQQDRVHAVRVRPDAAPEIRRRGECRWR